MRGGLQRWKRGAGSGGLGRAIDYAVKGTCDAHLHLSTGSDALEVYSNAVDASVTRFVVTDGGITANQLSAGALRVWLTGHDAVTGQERGTPRLSADADLLLDATLNRVSLIRSRAVQVGIIPLVAFAALPLLRDALALLQPGRLRTWRVSCNSQTGWRSSSRSSACDEGNADATVE